jgi:hypothetical protein
MSMQASGSGQSGPEELERALRRSLYRFDCPDAHSLGEYQLDLLDQQQRMLVAAHATECDECRDELHTLRTFLAAPTRIPETFLESARRAIARLLPRSSELAFGGLRGAPEASTRVFEAGDVTVTVGPGQTRGSLFGLVVAAGRDPESLDGRAVKLVPRDGAPLATRLDDLGNFEFAEIESGPYALEIGLQDVVVVVEELRVD